MPLLNRHAHSKATLGDPPFSFASSYIWNSITNDVRCAPSLSSSKSCLKTYLFRLVYKDLTLSLITVYMCMAWLCHSIVDGLSLKCINVHKKIFFLKDVKFINPDCLPILMLLYVMLCIMLAYLMLLAALSNAVCLYNAFLLFSLFIIYDALCIHALSWVIDI